MSSGFQRLRVKLLSLVASLIVITSGCGDGDDADPSPVRGAGVSNPALDGPVTGPGVPFAATTTFDLAEVGYSQAEYFISGTATAYSSAEELTVDGHWSATPVETAPYKTRILVYRPIDPARFNGTVIVEWLNVSRGLDFAPVWLLAHTELTRAGYVWAGVSAQSVGVEGASFIGAWTRPQPLKTVDRERYGSLLHPGDSFSFDIFSQAAQAMRRPRGVDPLEGLRGDTLIAVGESQSAFRLVTYINAVHPLADIYDGFLVQSRGGIGVPLSQAPLPAISTPAGSRIRTDLRDPVLTFVSETDLTLFDYLSARQADSESFRLWEVAGTSHADTYWASVGMTDKGESPAAAELTAISEPIPGLTCDVPINSGPRHFVLKAAVAALNDWARGAMPPPSAPRIEVGPGPSAAIVRDANGNALGGIRTPQIDVPIAQLSGEGQAGLILCILFGSTVPFDAAKLASLYPTRDAYVAAFNAATDDAVAAGHILPPDAELMKAAAVKADIDG